MDENLFHTVYKIRQELYGTSAEQEICRLRERVRREIQEDRIPDAPQFVMFEVTNRCNSNCQNCSHAMDNPHHEAKYEAPHEIALQVIQDAAALGVSALWFTGGEPLLRPDLPELIRQTADRHIVPVLQTNGLLLPEYWEPLGEAGLRYLVISFDSIRPGNYELQHGAEFHRAMAGIDAACRLQERYPGVRVHVSAALTRDNQEEFPDLIRFLTSRDIAVQISPCHSRQPDQEEALSPLEREQMEKLTATLLKMKGEGYLIANSNGFLRHLTEFFIQKKIMPDGFSCQSGYCTLVIHSNLDVTPCRDGGFAPLCNLKDGSVAAAWRSVQMMRDRRQMLCNQCPGCWHACAAESTLLLTDQEAMPPSKIV